MGFEIVEVEKRTEFGRQHLTVYIDKVPGGVSLDDCESVHYAIEDEVDRLDHTGGSPYVLEVSSPGLDRPFKKQRDYERNYGKEVEVKLYAPLKGKKVYEGTLIEKAESYLIITNAGGETKLETSRIALVRPLVRF